MLYAMLAMILLTFSVAIYMFRLRVAAVKTGKVKLSEFRLNNSANLPDKITQASRNYSNLFEVPVFFYIAGTLTITLQLENAAILILSWIFVGARIAHSWIHLTSNNVLHRLKAFMLGNISVFLIWLMLILQYTANQYN